MAADRADKNSVKYCGKGYVQCNSLLAVWIMILWSLVAGGSVTNWAWHGGSWSGFVFHSP